MAFINAVALGFVMVCGIGASANNIRGASLDAQQLQVDSSHNLDAIVELAAQIRTQRMQKKEGLARHDAKVKEEMEEVRVQQMKTEYEQKRMKQMKEVLVQLRSKRLEATLHEHAPLNWGMVGLGAAMGALVAGAIVRYSMQAGSSKQLEEEVGKEASVNEVGSKTEYLSMLSKLTKRMTEEVAPKFSKGGCVRDMLETRMTSVTDKAKNFLLGEINGVAGAVLKEIEAEESMLVLDWDNAVEANFPSPSALLAGVLSPTIISLMTYHHLVQVITVGIPLLLLCLSALYIDWGTSCSIPTLFPWLYTQTIVASLLLVGHAVLYRDLAAGKKALAKRRQEVQDNLGTTEDGSFSNMKEKLIGSTVILQEALLIENKVRSSFWNRVVALTTLTYLCTAMWNLALIIGWTFVPGATAFHPKAAAVAPDDYCGAWASVLVLRISVLLSLLYLFLNLATVLKAFCDMMISSAGFSDAIITQARKLDGNGLPIVEVLTNAFILRGGEVSIISRLAIVNHHKMSLLSKQADLDSKIQSVTYKIEKAALAEEVLVHKAKDGGDLAAQVDKLNGSSFDYDNWKKQGATAVEEAESKVVDVALPAQTDDLKKCHAKLTDVIEGSEALLPTAAAKACSDKAAAAAKACSDKAAARVE